jgi:transcription elongation factor GreB
MSKAFTKDEASDDPVVVRPRAPLPEGVPNYVTPRGLELLREELRALEGERARLDGSAEDPERRRASSELTARLAELVARVGTAELVEPSALAHDEVRFGATVEVISERDGERRYRIVGVDEADPAHGLVAFRAPIARALLGKRVGDVVTVHAPSGDDELEIVAIEYDPG